MERKHSNSKTCAFHKAINGISYRSARKKFYIPNEQDFQNFVKREHDFLVELKIQDLEISEFEVAVEAAQDARFNRDLNEYYFHYIGPEHYQEIKDELLDVPETRSRFKKFFGENSQFKKK